MAKGGEMKELFYKIINAIHESSSHEAQPTYDLITFQWPLPPNAITEGLRF